ncbi:cytosolic Fe-S cluster assembly factor NAR1 [Boeremia exigua]|uniref:cytosolic Fe-S cluster assembly factor NAR1 n=1 Tax=Boeremia exigua TaxID=749465 RepID=UPI001E8CE67B|nr:cytosolic Fe-S cluster assembly factor NAR1 [Boeremia exigua]KAH6615294.1 cytosolic Fe-S cluster assembly factor NAR1 [Boeremia exigua]
MSAILSADDLNDFISPGVACIKPIETLPVKEENSANPYEVTTEEKAAAAEPPPPAQISLTDCLACSGCVTSAEAVLVQLQSHNEVLSTLDTYKSLDTPWLAQNGTNGINGVANGHTHTNGCNGHHAEGRLFVASVSPQARASLAAVFNVSEAEAGNMITQLLSGPSGVKAGGNQGSGFTWVIDTDVVREACLVAAADEVATALSPETSKTIAKPGSEGAIDTTPKGPILTSACPGWICYAEKTHPYVLPYLSRLKSPQALTGTLIKSVLSQRYNIAPSQIWHLAIMPCFDKKLEASRSELTSTAWLPSHDPSEPVRDVDCVITARELLSLASARNISFTSLPRTPLAHRTPFPDPTLDAFLFPPSHPKTQSQDAGTSGGYLYHILQTYQTAHPGSTISVSRGRNADVVEYTLTLGADTLLRTARFYGFRNIQNLVRRLKPAKASRLPGGKTGAVRRPPGKAAPETKDYAYVEVMACPGGCTNGGGQVKLTEVAELRARETQEPALLADSEPVKPGPAEQKEWLARVDEAYFSASDSESDEERVHADAAAAVDAPDALIDIVNGVDRRRVRDVVAHWARITGVDAGRLLYTSYRKVESDVGKKVSDMERVAGLAVTVGGGW